MTTGFWETVKIDRCSEVEIPLLTSANVVEKVFTYLQRIVGLPSFFLEPSYLPLPPPFFFASLVVFVYF